MPKPRAHIAHTCHATGCKTRVPPRMFMCRPHWAQVPKHLKKALWAAYEPGQEERKDPSIDYLRAAQDVVAWLEENGA